MTEVIAVVGMHRSGTSAVAGVLKHLGVDFGPTAKLMPPSPANPRGYFENLDVVAIHEKLLGDLGCRWNDVRLRGEWVLTKAADEATESARNWLSALKGSGPFGIKDPRMCLFHTVWTVAAQLAGIEPVPLVVIRDQAAVVASLGRRDRMSPRAVRELMVTYGEGVWGWWVGVNPPRAKLVYYEQLVEDPRAVVFRLANALRLSPTTEQFEEAVGFVDGGLNHA